MYPDTWGRSYVTRQAAAHTCYQPGRSRCQASWELGRRRGREGTAEVGSCGKAGRFVSISGSGAAWAGPAVLFVFLLDLGFN